MREEDLRAIHLVRAIEEVEAAVPIADREAAAREARRESPDAPAPRLMAARARLLLARIVERHPFVERVGRFDRGAGIVAALLVVGAFAAGLALSALDGERRINVLAFPLAGLVTWNLVVYGILAVGLARAAKARVPGPIAWATQSALSWATRLAARSRAFHAPLAAGLERFVREWSVVAAPLLRARAACLLHGAAAAMGLGLVAGLYLRGIAYDYSAGWESTFLDANGARAFLAVLYAPATLLPGLGIPDAAHLESIRWRAGGGGENAAPWIHRLAAVAFVMIILPRLVLAAIAGTRAWTAARAMREPEWLGAAYRAAFEKVPGALAPSLVLVVPYAWEASPRSMTRLAAWLPTAIGPGATVDATEAIAYGDEEALPARLEQRAAGADVVVLPFSLATTPEAENHGRVITDASDWLTRRRSGARLLVVVDEAPYAARVPAARVAERRELWRAFVADRGLTAQFTSLAP